MRNIFIITTTALLLLLSVCGTMAKPIFQKDEAFILQEQERLKWQKIAILTFTEMADYPGSSAENFLRPIRRQQYFEIIEPTVAKTELMKHGIELSDTRIELEEAREAGQVIGADAVIIASINVMAERGKWYDVLVAGCSLVDVGTGRIVATSIRSVRIGDMESKVDRKQIDAAAEEVAEDMLSVLNELATGKVLPRKGESLPGEVTPVVKRESNWTGNINFFVGEKSFDEDDWQPLENQTEGGVKVDFKKKKWPVSIALGLMAATKDEDKDGKSHVSTSSYELDFGVKKIWGDHSRFRPFIAGGVAMIDFKSTMKGVSDNSNALGFWIEGGVYWTLINRFNLGLNARFSKAEAQLFDVEKELGGEHLGVLIGYHW